MKCQIGGILPEITDDAAGVLALRGHSAAIVRLAACG
jgi:hypothetical protein